jgi:menaquinone-dependent protoporphyrinogen IX oxidase
MANTFREMGINADAIDLKKGAKELFLDDYDLVILGSGIMAGRWSKEPLKFIKSNLHALLEKRVALFVVCAYAANPEMCDTVQTQFLDKVVEKYPGFSPVSTAYFGGVVDFDKYNFAVRKVMEAMARRMAGPDEEIPRRTDLRDWDKIREWTKSLVQ